MPKVCARIALDSEQVAKAIPVVAASHSRISLQSSLHMSGPSSLA